MKTKQSITKAIITSLLVLFLGTLLAVQAHGQIYVSDNTNGTVGEYNLDGTAINPSLISGLTQPAGLALSGKHLYVIVHGDGTNGTVQVYNATTGAVINPSLVTAPQLPEILALSGNNLYVVRPDND